MNRIISDLKVYQNLLKINMNLNELSEKLSDFSLKTNLKNNCFEFNELNDKICKTSVNYLNFTVRKVNNKVNVFGLNVSTNVKQIIV